jgi:predicted component of type VI protein secretion system
LDLQINRESIRNGSLDVERCSLVMPDGMVVNVPHVDPAPESRSLEGHFDPVTGVVEVYLAIPAKRVGAPNFQSNGGDRRGVRYSQVAGTQIDETRSTRATRRSRSPRSRRRRRGSSGSSSSTSRPRSTRRPRPGS